MFSSDTRELQRLVRNLEDYAVVSRLTMSEILDKKGNDLRIQLFKLFWEQKFGGKGKRKADIAFRELARRAKNGIGTLVRMMTLDSNVGTPPETASNGRKLTLWQKLVWQETERRSHGIGVIAIGLLSRRYRTRRVLNSATGAHSVERYTEVNQSRALGELVKITKDENSYTIRGMTPGMSEVATRYGIKAKAMAKVSEDMEPYLARKFGEASRSAFRRR